MTKYEINYNAEVFADDPLKALDKAIERLQSIRDGKTDNYKFLMAEGESTRLTVDFSLYKEEDEF